MQSVWEVEKILSDSCNDGTNLAAVEDVSEVLGEGEGRESTMASGDNTLVQYQQDKINGPCSVRESDHYLYSVSSPPLPSQTQQPLPSSSSPHSLAHQSLPPIFEHETESQENLEVGGGNVRTSMAGIGTAFRTGVTYLVGFEFSARYKHEQRSNELVVVLNWPWVGHSGPSHLFAFTTIRA